MPSSACGWSRSAFSAFASCWRFCRTNSRERRSTACASAWGKVLSRILNTLPQHPVARRHDHSSSSDTSRYLLLPHSLSATYLSLAVRHECRCAVRKRAHHPRPHPDLAVEALDGVVRADVTSVLNRKARVRERLKEALAHDLGRLFEPHVLELGSDLFCLGNGGL